MSNNNDCLSFKLIYNCINKFLFVKKTSSLTEILIFYFLNKNYLLFIKETDIELKTLVKILRLKVIKLEKSGYGSNKLFERIRYPA